MGKNLPCITIHPGADANIAWRGGKTRLKAMREDRVTSLNVAFDIDKGITVQDVYKALRACADMCKFSISVADWARDLPGGDLEFDVDLKRGQKFNLTIEHEMPRRLVFDPIDVDELDPDDIETDAHLVNLAGRAPARVVVNESESQAAGDDRAE